MRTTRTHRIAIAAVAAGTLLLAACSSDEASDEPADETTTTAMADDTPTDASESDAGASEEDAGTIVEVASEAGDFTTLVAAVEAAGLVETLSGPGPYTVFAPTDAAFEKLPEGTVEDLLANPDELAKVLTYHVVAGEVTSDQVVELTEATTVNGATVPITVDGETVKVGDATVVAVDVPASNGVIHVIDTVLIPPAS